MAEPLDLTDKECFQKFSEDICERDHKEQCSFFLNVFWGEYFKDINDLSDKEKMDLALATERLLKKNKLDKSDVENLPQTERVWIAYKYFCLLDKKNTKGQNNNLDESPGSHRLLELMGVPLTIIEFRKVFKKIDQNFDKKMGMVEYLVYKYNLDEKPADYIYAMMRRPEGNIEKSKELIEAEKKMEEIREEIRRLEKKRIEYETKSKGEGRAAEAAKKGLERLLAQEAEMDKLETKWQEHKAISRKGGVKGRRAEQAMNIMLAQNYTLLLYVWKLLKDAERIVDALLKKCGAGEAGEAGILPGDVYMLERALLEAKCYKPSASNFT